MTIYIFGNQLIEKDAVGIKLLPKLKKTFPQLNFILADPNEDIFQEKKIIIIDTVLGLEKVSLIFLDQLQKIKKTPVSPHDYDLLFNLWLLKKTKKIKEAIIIGLPAISDSNKIWLDLKKVIANLLLKNEQRKTYMGQKPE